MGVRRITDKFWRNGEGKDTMLKAMIWTSEKIRAVKEDAKGVTALEYGVLAAGIVVAVAAAALLVGNQLTALFAGIVNSLTPPAA